MGKHSKNKGNSPQGAPRPLGRTLEQALQKLEHLGYHPRPSDDGMAVKFFHKGHAYALRMSGARFTLYEDGNQVGSPMIETDGAIVVMCMKNAGILP